MKRIIVTLLAACALLQAGAAELNWMTDLSKAQEQAKKENKLVLIDFTGSDWCPWCVKLDKETLSQPEFADYATKNLVLVKVDFLRHTEQPGNIKKANEALAKKYEVEAFPTEIALNADGKVVMTQVGYLAGGPKALIAKLDKAKKE
ncbi:MAG TPA: thioredoxin family protein [Verrucomicrobiae bacterium]|nr:thioredoxin family protein [Verrucomicrobiae bacterium]